MHCGTLFIYLLCGLDGGKGRFAQRQMKRPSRQARSKLTAACEKRSIVRKN
jgi:hypothetical protein